MPLFRKRQKGLGQECQLGNPNRQLSRFGAEQMPSHSNRIAQIQQVKQLEALLSHYVFPDINLDALATSLEVGKASLAHQAVGNDPPCHFDSSFLSFQVSG